jgi:hypothetical protein
LCGQIKSEYIYARVGYAKTYLSASRDLADYISDDTGDRLDNQFINNIEENGHIVEFTLFGQHQFTPFLHIGYEIYREYYEIEGLEISKEDPIPNVYDVRGEAGGGELNWVHVMTLAKPNSLWITHIHANDTKVNILVSLHLPSLGTTLS